MCRSVFLSFFLCVCLSVCVSRLRTAVPFESVFDQFQHDPIRLNTFENVVEDKPVNHLLQSHSYLAIPTIDSISSNWNWNWKVKSLPCNFSNWRVNMANYQVEWIYRNCLRFENICLKHLDLYFSLRANRAITSVIRRWSTRFHMAHSEINFFISHFHQTPESKKQEFRKYLEKSGVIDALTKGTLLAAWWSLLNAVCTDIVM